VARITERRNLFSGAWTINAERATPHKALIITGAARGGTSFAASAFLRLGVPFGRGEKECSRRTHEHFDLRTAFQAGDEAEVRRLAEDIAAAHPVWAWKLPDIHAHFDRVERTIAAPHYVLVFKEPVATAFRRVDVRGVPFDRSLAAVLNDYVQMATFAAATTAPVLFVSYEAAMDNPAAFLAEAARFAGIDTYDADDVVRKIERDAKRYYPAGREGDPDSPL
jgi:hypothetical protein